MKRCPWCGRLIRQPRSPDISRRFQAHITWMTRELHGQKNRDQVYLEVLRKAVEIDPPPGGSPYPADYKPYKLPEWPVPIEVAFPLPTSGRTNKEMVTACEAAQMVAFEWDLGTLPEKTDWIEEQQDADD